MRWGVSRGAGSGSRRGSAIVADATRTVPAHPLACNLALRHQHSISSHQRCLVLDGLPVHSIHTCFMPRSAKPICLFIHPSIQPPAQPSHNTKGCTQAAPLAPHRCTAQAKSGQRLRRQIPLLRYPVVRRSKAGERASVLAGGCSVRQPHACADGCGLGGQGWVRMAGAADATG